MVAATPSTRQTRVKQRQIHKKGEDLNKRQKDSLKATQTKVTQSPKPKPMVTATNLH